MIEVKADVNSTETDDGEWVTYSDMSGRSYIYFNIMGVMLWHLFTDQG